MLGAHHCSRKLHALAHEDAPHELGDKRVLNAG
jgi:hypothetical protein